MGWNERCEHFLHPRSELCRPGSGEEFNSKGAGKPDLRVEVLSIDDNQRVATVRLTYVPAPVMAQLRSAASGTLSRAGLGSSEILGTVTSVPSLEQPLLPPQL